ncbi:hypothetical protein dsx2_0445 [Desulfovibrio sp. X2]|uniref:FeoB-associated Cys-rich membrane protein n=1 Tax=Desulfovibrio sp. X2 TaxID=941449 RepID=UPI000358A477|nr:FeoB-associated Cys-rich membrane protein [Desulfovibrio sp. X2]EPR39871.1 hypothetical protein dsx2_0445 [Desulfovibrio sp. X2]
MQNIIVFAIVAAAAIYVIRKARASKAGGCACSGGCSDGCSGVSCCSGHVGHAANGLNDLNDLKDMRDTTGGNSCRAHKQP